MKLIKLIAAILLASTLLISCSKDDTSGSKNYLKIGNTKYDFTGAYMQRSGTGGRVDGHRTELNLMTGYLRRDQGWYTGKGNLISFAMYTTTDQEMDSREFVYESPSPQPNPIGTFLYSMYIINIDMSKGTQDDLVYIKDGTINVSKDGLYYTLNIDCISERGEKVTGFYKGTIFYEK